MLLLLPLLLILVLPESSRSLPNSEKRLNLDQIPVMRPLRTYQVFTLYVLRCEFFLFSQHAIAHAYYDKALLVGMQCS